MSWLGRNQAQDLVRGMWLPTRNGEEFVITSWQNDTARDMWMPAVDSTLTRAKAMTYDWTQYPYRGPLQEGRDAFYYTRSGSDITFRKERLC